MILNFQSFYQFIKFYLNQNSLKMSNLSTEHLIKCITEKEKYKFTQQYIKEVEMQNENVYDFVNQALFNILTNNKNFPTTKLYALRFFKDLVISAQFQLIDGLNESILKHIVKVCQFDKQNKDKQKRGSSYFQQVEKRSKQNDIEKMSYSYVLLATQIIYVLGTWHPLDENNQPTDYSFVFEKLKNSKVPFPINDKQLKFFKPEEREIFMKNYKEWVDKLPQIEQESDEDEKQNLKSKKSIKSRQKLPLADEEKQVRNQTSMIEKKSSFTKIKDEDIQKLRNQLQKVISQKDSFQKRVIQLQNSVKQLKDQLKKEQRQSQVTKANYSKSEEKYIKMQEEFSIFQKKISELQQNLLQSQSINEKQRIENQQFRLMNKKISNEKSQMEERLNGALKQSLQKIGRLEKQIQHLNSIKNSYSSIMEEHKLRNEAQKLAQKDSSRESKIKDLQNQIQQTVQFYTKQQVKLKDQIKTLTLRNQELQNQLQDKNSLVQLIQSDLKQKNQRISELQNQIHKKHQDFKQFVQNKDNDEAKKLTAEFFTSQPELKTLVYPQKSNSMSQYLFNQTSLLKKTIQSNQNSYETLKSRQNQSQQKNKNHSLGKTQKSLQKRKQMNNRRSNGKTFHFTNGDPYKSFEINQGNLQKRSHLGLGLKKGHTNSSNDLWATITKPNDPKQQVFPNKKSSVLNLNRTQKFQELTSPKQGGVQTLIPYIVNYFPSNMAMNQQYDSFLFKSQCLFPIERSSKPIFKNQFLQIRLLKYDEDQKSIFMMQIANLSLSAIKIKAVSCHEQFKLNGEKTRIVHPNTCSEYQIETHVKDLNLRYPIVSLIVTQNSAVKPKNLTFNIQLPLTMLQFTQIREQIPKFCGSYIQNLRILQSQKFILNSNFSTLEQCFPKLVFQHRAKSGLKGSKLTEIFWQGNLRHSFIENIDVYMKMSQMQNQVSLQFRFKNQDKISENYSKVMIQTLMFLLQ